MSRRMTALIAGAGVSALVLSACGGGSGSGTATDGSGDGAKKVTSIKLVAAEYSKDHTAAFWKQFAEKYKAKTGITLDVQVVSWDSIDQQSSTMIQNNNAPDLLNLNVYASYAKDKLLYSADEVLSPEVKADVLDAFVKSGTYQDKMYGMPDLSSARALFYNKDLFTKAGIAAPPKTWDEFEADAKKVQALGNGNIGYAMPLGPEESQGEFSIWAFNNGGDWKTDGKWAINSAKNVETLTFLKKLSVEDKVTQNNPGKTNRAQAFDLFKSGKAGMVVGFSPLAGALDTDKKVNYGVAPMPTKEAGGTPQTFGDQVNQFIKDEGFLPVTKSGLEIFASDAKLKVYLDTLPNVHLTPTDDPTWDKVKLAVQQNLGAGVGANGDPQAVLTALQKTAESGS
jgi:multiple sugar transport system substrate-binding protein